MGGLGKKNMAFYGKEKANHLSRRSDIRGAPEMTCVIGKLRWSFSWVCSVDNWYQAITA